MIYAKYQLKSDTKNEMKIIKLKIIPKNRVEVFEDISNQLNIDIEDIFLYLIYEGNNSTNWIPK